MNFAGGLARQLAHPVGRAGRLLGSAMDVLNRRPMRLAVHKLAVRPGEDVLDAGCGTGAALAEMGRSEPASLTGIDRSQVMLDMARRSIGKAATLLSADLGVLPLEDCSIDAALALNVLYFDGRDHCFVRELHRVLRPGGRMVAYVTHRDTMQGWSFVREGLHHLYDADGLRNAFIAGGFAENEVDVHEVAVTRKVRGLIGHARRGS